MNSLMPRRPLGPCTTAHELSPLPRGPVEYEVFVTDEWLPYCALCALGLFPDEPRRPVDGAA